jgi:peroxiredoxin
MRRQNSDESACLPAGRPGPLLESERPRSRRQGHLGEVGGLRTNRMKNYILQNNNGEDFDFYKYQEDKSLLILFFRGVWCNYCKTQLKEINDNLADLEKLNLKIIAISSDTKFNSSLITKFFRLKFPVLADPNFEVINDFKLKTTYKDKQIAKPAVFLFSPEHEELFQFIGDTYDDRMAAEDLMPQLKKILTK